MNRQLYVHPRVFDRHPELMEQDVMATWENAIYSAPRLEKDPDGICGNWI